MSIDIKLIQTATDKKTLPLKVILGADFLYGAYDDGWRLRPGLIDDNDIVCYMPMHLARGIAVTWSEDEVDLINIRALTPTSKVELRALYEMVYRICSYWDCSLFVDGKLTDIESFFEGYDAMVDFNYQSLHKMAKSVMDGENLELTLFSVKWPLVMGRSEAEAFIVEPSYFSKWMHEKQNIDAHHSNPAFYRTIDGVIGRYSISENFKYILPIKPYVPYGYDDPETGDLLECEDFGIMYFDTEKLENVWEVDYKTFISIIRKKHSSKIKRFDGNHIIVEGLTYEELNSLLED